jgi:hypothetical protein
MAIVMKISNIRYMFVVVMMANIYDDQYQVSLLLNSIDEKLDQQFIRLFLLRHAIAIERDIPIGNIIGHILRMNNEQPHLSCHQIKPSTISINMHRRQDPHRRVLITIGHIPSLAYCQRVVQMSNISIPC